MRQSSLRALLSVILAALAAVTAVAAIEAVAGMLLSLRASAKAETRRGGT
jgi:hypothetical protein